MLCDRFRVLGMLHHPLHVGCFCDVFRAVGFAFSGTPVASWHSTLDGGLAVASGFGLHYADGVHSAALMLRVMRRGVLLKVSMNTIWMHCSP